VKRVFRIFLVPHNREDSFLHCCSMPSAKFDEGLLIAALCRREQRSSEATEYWDISPPPSIVTSPPKNADCVPLKRSEAATKGAEESSAMSDK